MPEECFSRQTLRDLLTDWAGGAIDDSTFAGKSEELWQKYGVWQNWPKEDKRSVTFGALDKMRLQGDDKLSKTDVPKLLDFLNTEYGQEVTGWGAWEEYWNSGRQAVANQ
ncbi:MAG: hypothetical protein H6684_08075 [Deltaproteobacteria bacterium]|nr:hypothetical protein [Deltaproteobacteria bacterium]MCB9488672.1 hypothetical protein [Deltaproteobacteria bacterium]